MFHEYGAEIFTKELRGEVTVTRPRKKPVDEVEITLDKNGIPIWPEEDREKPWNLETKKLVVREFMTAHYGLFFYPLFVPQTNAGHSSSFGEI